MVEAGLAPLLAAVHHAGGEGGLAVLGHLAVHQGTGHSPLGSGWTPSAPSPASHSSDTASN